MKKEFKFLYPLIIEYAVGGKAQTANLGSLYIYGVCSLKEGDVSIHDKTYSLAPLTTLNQLMEWLRFNDESNIDVAIQQHCEALFEQQDHSLQLLPDALS